MSKIERFEDLEVWQKAIDLAVRIYTIIKSGPYKLESPIQNQLIGSSFSISNNIAEGFEHNSTKQFIRYLKISKASAGELRNQLYFLKKIQYIDQETFQVLLNDCMEVSKKISSFITYLRTYEKSKTKK